MSSLPVLAEQNLRMKWSSKKSLYIEYRWCTLSLLVFWNISSVESAFKFENCSHKESIIQFSLLDLKPDPIDMEKSVIVSARGEILDTIPPNALMDIQYYRLQQVFGMHFDIRIPCLLGKYGSCTLPFCEYMERFKKHACTFLINEIDCDCPPKPGEYHMEDVEIAMGETSVVGRFIAKGRYRTEMRLKASSSEEELACLKFYTDLV